MCKRLLFLVLSCVFLLTGCGSQEKKHRLDPDALVGMTKDEVLTLAFAKCPRGHNGELVIRVREINLVTGESCPGNKSCMDCEFKTLADAKSAAVLKNSDNWELDQITVSSSSFPFSEFEGLNLHFTDGRVVKAGKIRWSDSM